MLKSQQIFSQYHAIVLAIFRGSNLLVIAVSLDRIMMWEKYTKICDTYSPCL